MIKLENKQNKWSDKKEPKAYDRLYLIHHMHHFKLKRGTRHELHHCCLFEGKNKKGKKYYIVHRIFADKVYHCLADKFEGRLFDHANNAFQITKKLIKNKKIYEII